MVEKEIIEQASDVAARTVRAWARAFRLHDRELGKVDRMSEASPDVPVLSPRDLVRGLEIVTRTEARLAGASPSSPQGVDYSEWSTEDLGTLRELLGRYAKGA